MLSEVREHFALVKDFSRAGYYETDHQKQMFKEIRATIPLGLTRHGYNVRGLAEQFNAKPAEIRSLFRGQLEPMRARELQEQMLMAGLPI